MDVNRRAPRREGELVGVGRRQAGRRAPVLQGEVTAVRRNGFTRYYMLPELWLPPELLAAPTPTSRRRKALLLVGAAAHGVGTARDLADYYRLNVPAARPLVEELAAEGALVPVRVEGWSSRPTCTPTPGCPAGGRARALLSPFDSLIWERSRTERLWGIHYRIEIYVPDAQAGARLLRAAVPAGRGPGGPGRPQGRPPGRRACGCGPPGPSPGGPTATG